MPAGHTADWAGYAAAPTGSSYTVAGTRFPSVDKDGSALVIGDEGVSLTAGEETATVLYRACAAVLNWPDGGRRLIGDDGLSVAVEPVLYGIDAHTMATLDAAVPPTATVRLPPRQRQPRPNADIASAAGDAARDAGGPARRTGSGTGSGRAGKTAPAWRTGGQTAALVVFGILAGLCSCVALAYTVFGVSDPQTTTGEWAALAAFLWGVAALPAWPAVRIVRRTRRV
ncbi:hypothetical protein ACFYO2_26305 [Streptomyces sp. NPDC006602]|uniref:hypothetical protein n=1 Tax=Streptomyces sp. NPDC006602 TaxID=3364751 RepID=UPI00368D3C17